ncbi:MAG: biosynthetic arginine decarboxylase [Chthoniobacterales bacterium]
MAALNSESAVSLYNVNRWGGGYFSVGEAGNIVVHPRRRKRDLENIDLMDVVEEAKNRNLDFPLVVRFQDLLRQRVETLNEAFASAIKELGYQSNYRGVFPIKVNQLREVVEEILDAGKPYHFGIEAGSKPELMAALSVHEDDESLIICNGYKDSEFIRLALLGRKLEKQVILVVEKLEELYQILALAEKEKVEPLIGLRVRLLSKGAGKWATSGGENAKFGLSTTDLVAASKLLKERNLGHCLRLIHFHVGSQIPDIGTVKRATREAARFYAKLQKMGHEIGIIDVGGGLGVDYDGSRTNFDSSTNYSLEEYTRDIVHNIKDVLDAEQVPHPIICSESGRALVAHHSILIVEAFGSIEKHRDINTEQIQVSENDPKVLQDMAEILAGVGKTHRMEDLHDAQQLRDQAQSMFDLGMLELPEKAKIDTLYWHIAERIVEMSRDMGYVPEEIKDVETALGDQFICNYSVFQSLLDHWALGKIFPVMPIHRLNEKQERFGFIVYITCD